MTTYTATYSPDDNKLRLTASARLDAETYARVKEAGFSWAPKQEQFIAPMWTPSRADLCTELAGEIDDEDGSLIDRAEVRAERFAGYEAKRGAEAERAADHARSLAGSIPFGQPILVGHHSEARARRDAKRIEVGMQRAVDLFDTSEYWKRRAAAAIRHARYIERADVRHRRIKGLEADQRKQQKTIDKHAAASRLWGKVPRFEWDAQTFVATAIAGRMTTGYGLYSALSDGKMHGDTAWRSAVALCERLTAYAHRWLDHISNRLDYERAMLVEAGGIAADKFDLQPGGVVETTRGRRQVIVRVNRKDGRTLSVSVAGQGWTVGIEEITAYEPPTETAAAAVAEAAKKAPICNYPSEGCATMTQAEWTEIYKDSKRTRTVKATPTQVEHRRRMVDGHIGPKFGAPRGEQWGLTAVFISDAKRTDPADPSAPPKTPRARKAAAPAPSAAPAPEAAETSREPAPTMTERALAAAGLTSYRYRGRYGWIMIGAKDDADAIREVARSTDGPTPENLEVWDGAAYVPAACATPADDTPLSSDQVSAIAHNQLRKCDTQADGTIPREAIMRTAEALESCADALAPDSSLQRAYRASVSRLRALAAVDGAERAAMVAVIDAGAARYFGDPAPMPEPLTLRDVVTAAALSEAPADLAALQARRDVRANAAAPFEAMCESLRGGALTTCTPQLFPSPPDLAQRMVTEADIEPGMRVLEPSGGSGRILTALAAAGATDVTAIEIKSHLAEVLRSGYRVPTHCADFLACTPGNVGQFERVVMNPPFAAGADVAHVTHAVQFLRPGGRLVAIMSAGVTFREDRKTRAFRALVEQLGGTIEPLPPGTFDSSGTGVNTVLVVLHAPGFDHERAAAHRMATGVAA